MIKDYTMTNAEYRFACIVWEQEPIESAQLCKICEGRLGWKRTTTYTVLKRLCERGMMQNSAAVVTSLVRQDQVQQQTSQGIVKSRFDDNLPQFVTAFLNGRKISKEEAEQIKALIDANKMD